MRCGVTWARKRTRGGYGMQSSITAGRCHIGYGVHDAHYDTVGVALLKTLEQGLGEEFTRPVREAWAEVYGVMTDVMLAAARQES